MFSQWAVEALKRITARVRPRIRLAHHIHLLADIFFVISFFFCLNRQIRNHYNFAFWKQLLHLVQLLKAVYMLRFLVVELVYRELKSFICFIGPGFAKLNLVKKFAVADPCVLKVMHVAFFLIFIILNILIALGIEFLLCAIRQRLLGSGPGSRGGRIACQSAISADSAQRLPTKDCMAKMASYKGDPHTSSYDPDDPMEGSSGAPDVVPEPSRQNNRTRSSFTWPRSPFKVDNIHPRNMVLGQRAPTAAKSTRSGRMY